MPYHLLGITSIPLYLAGGEIQETSRWSAGCASATRTVDGGDTVTATVTLTNTGDRAGADVPQLYLTETAGDQRTRLLGFERVELQVVLVF
jgi:hypothetical protein